MKVRSSLLLAAGMFLGMILRGDGQPAIIQFAHSQFSVSESLGSATISVQRSGNLDDYGEVLWTTSDGTATADQDYIPGCGIVGFPPGQTNQTFTIPILNDTVVEGDETVRLELSACIGCFGEFILGAQSNAVLTIVESARVEFSPATYTVDEAAGVAVVTVRATETGNSFSVDYSTSDRCNATAGLDYLPQSGTLNFARGETEKTISIPILDDALAEGDETLGLGLSHPVGVMLGVQSNAVLWIRDNDPRTDSGVDLTPQRVGIWSAALQGTASAIAVVDNYAYVGADGFYVLDIRDPANARGVGACSAIGRVSGVAVSGNYAYVVSTSSSAFDMIDISDPANPRLIGQYVVSEPNGVAVSGDHAYVAWYGGLLVLDVSNPANPRFASSYDCTNHYYAESVAVSGNLAYLGSYGGSGGLHVIDISDPANPERIGGYDGPQVQRVVLSGHYAFVAGYGGVTVIDISDPADPQPVGSFTFDGYATDLVVSGGFAYVTERFSDAEGLVILDVTQPSNPQRVGGYEARDSFGVAVSGNLAYVTGAFGLDALDIVVPTNMVRVGSVPTLSGPRDVAVSGNFVYLADGPGGLLVIDASDTARPRPVGRAATRNEAGGIAITCNDSLVAEGTGLEVFDINNPASPRRLDQLEGDCTLHTAMAVEGGRAVLTVLTDVYCGGSHGGLDIIDVSNTAHPQRLGSYRSNDSLRGTLDVALSGNFAYLAVGFPPHLQIIDLSDPSNPQRVGTTTHLSIEGALDLALSGNFVYIADALIGLTIIDVSNPASPQPIGTYTPTDIGSPFPLGSLSSLTVAGDRLYVAGSAGVELIDIRDPTRPRHSAFYKTDAAVTAVAVRGDHAFLAEITGLEIIDLNPLGFLPGSTTPSAGGQMQFTLNARTGRSYTVQASTNLVDWVSLGNLTASDTKPIFTDTNAPNFDRRFYRAVSR